MNRIFVVLAFVSICSVGCEEEAPAMKRVLNDEQIDEHYLKDVFIPAYSGESSRAELANSVSKLEEHLAEFRAFMRQVEVGKIPVAHGMKNNWQSFVKKDDGWIAAEYSGRLGTVIDFQKHKNQDPFPLIYGFRFSTNGHLISADTIEDSFGFDERGRVQQYWHSREKGH
jgi:hypothetical protein